MAKRKENQTDVVQVAQSQPAAAESKVKMDPDPGQSQSPEDEAQGNPEPLQIQLPEEAKAVVEVEAGQTQPAGEKEDVPLQEKQKYRIICRNPVSKEIGGVTFVNGVGYTDDGFTASWFRNRGYEVSGA